ncbi:PoNe immunity protein domain-containing protein [Comamonas sp. NoAH]|uniref:PoNe immunity protein domain-containing protein n=1 Tax=Comamonas halotolerans TaxID=3041496 RepID=UPI0024E16ACE|nr:PoNe immunity protein domain-containing protein [Comamonas sp. NoAH]
MLNYADLPHLIADAQAIDWSCCEPRRKLHLGSWQEDWEDNLAMLESFVADGAYGVPSSDMDSYELQDACMQWDNAAETASTLLRLALDRGAPASVLRPLYLQVTSVWRDYADLLQQSRNSGCAHTSQAIRAETSEYQFALQLLAMAVLLDEQGEIPAIVEHLLHFQSDRLLDYLSAAATGLQEASDEYFHPSPFSGLNDFLDQYGDVFPEPLQPYLEQHYDRFFALSPKEQSRQQRLTGPQAWGWWALEVGALVVLYDLDDSVLRDNPHYPADLVDYALGVRD